MGKMKELFTQYQEENDNLEWGDCIHYVEYDLDEPECRLILDEVNVAADDNEMESILEFLDKISEN